MGTSVSFSDITAILKELVDDEYEDLIVAEEAAIGLLPKNTNGGGKYRRLPFAFGTTTGIGTTFSGALASKGPATRGEWQINWVDLYSLLSIDRKAAKLAMGDGPRAFVDLIDDELRLSQKGYAKMLQAYIFGNGGGALGEIESGAGTATITLTDRSSLSFFEKGMWIAGSTDDGGIESPQAGLIGNPQKIGTVNRQTRQLTVASGVWDPIAFANGNFIFLRESYANAIAGFAGWLPLTPPSSAPWFGVDRTQDDRLFGMIRIGDPAEDSTLTKFIMSLMMDVAMEGGRPDCGICSYKAYTQILKQLDSKGFYVYPPNSAKAKAPSMSDMYGQSTREMASYSNGSVSATAGFSGISIIAHAGQIPFYPSRNCPTNTIYLLQKDTWMLQTVDDPLGSYLDYGDDDDKFARHTQQDAMEARIGNYLNMFCTAPKYNGVGDVTAYLAV